MKVRLTQYLRGLAAHRRAHPLTWSAMHFTRLIAGDANGQALSETELLQNCIFCSTPDTRPPLTLSVTPCGAANGHKSARAAGVAVSRSAQSPEEEALMVPAVDEFLRFESSNQWQLPRAYAHRVAAWRCLKAPPYLMHCAANRDPEVFAQPHAS